MIWVSFGKKTFYDWESFATYTTCASKPAFRRDTDLSVQGKVFPCAFLIVRARKNPRRYKKSPLMPGATLHRERCRCFDSHLKWCYTKKLKFARVQLITRLLQCINPRVGCIKLPRQEYNFSKPSLTAVCPISPLFRYDWTGKARPRNTGQQLRQEFNRLIAIDYCSLLGKIVAGCSVGIWSLTWSWRSHKRKGL